MVANHQAIYDDKLSFSISNSHRIPSVLRLHLHTTEKKRRTIVIYSRTYLKSFKEERVNEKIQIFCKSSHYGFFIDKLTCIWFICWVDLILTDPIGFSHQSDIFNDLIQLFISCIDKITEPYIKPSGSDKTRYLSLNILEDLIV